SHADDVHDRTTLPLDHSWTDRIHRINVGKILGIHALLPRFGIQFLPWKTACRPRAINKDVDRSEEFFGLLDSVFGVPDHRKIRLHGHRSEFLLSEVAARLFQVFFTSRTN